MRAEAMRQEDHAELIASENYASPLVMAVQDSVFTNKYAEGYPPPLLQRLRARGRGRTPGAGAGQGAVRLRLRQRPAACRRPGQRGRVPALTRPGDTVMGMNLAQGGHLTHGNPSTLSGRHYHIVPYGLDPETGLIDYDEMERIALRTRPRMLIGGFSAYSRHKDWARMRAIADQVGAVFWVTWRTWPDWSPRACIPARCRTRTWSPAPRTRRCAAARRHHPGRGRTRTSAGSSIPPSSRHPGRAADDVIAAKAVAFRKRWRRPSRTTSARWWPTRAPWRP